MPYFTIEKSYLFIPFELNVKQKKLLNLFITNKETLRINDTNPDSEQVFYGYTDAVDVKTGFACFTSHGTIGTMDLKQGKATVNKGAYVGLIKAASGTTAEEKTKIMKVANIK